MAAKAWAIFAALSLVGCAARIPSIVERVPVALTAAAAASPTRTVILTCEPDPRWRGVYAECLTVCFESSPDLKNWVVATNAPYGPACRVVMSNRPIQEFYRVSAQWKVQR